MIAARTEEGIMGIIMINCPATGRDVSTGIETMSPRRARESRSVQAGPLEKAVAIAGGDAHLEGAAVAIDRHRHFHAGLAERPDLAKKTGKVLDLIAGNREHDVAGAQIGSLGRRAVGDPRHHDLVLDLGCVEPQPGPRRTVGPPEREQILEDRLENVDRDDHVQRLGRAAFAYPLHLQRADAQKLARAPDHRGAAPERMRGRGKIASSRTYSQLPANSCLAAMRATTECLLPPSPATTTESPTFAAFDCPIGSAGRFSRASA